MSTKLTHKLTVFIPKNVQRGGVVTACVNLSKLCKGMTAMDGSGFWYDGTGKGYQDKLVLATWWYTADKESDVLALSGHLYDAMFKYGEMCVMAEKYTPQLGLRAHLFYP